MRRTGRNKRKEKECMVEDEEKYEKNENEENEEEEKYYHEEVH